MVSSRIYVDLLSPLLCARSKEEPLEHEPGPGARLHFLLRAILLNLRPSAARDPSGPRGLPYAGPLAAGQARQESPTPGRIGLTRRLLEAAGPTSTDRVIELGPGVGRTAEILLATRPASYKGVDPSPEGREQVADILAAHSRQTDTEYVVADAASTGLPTSVRTSSWARRC